MADNTWQTLSRFLTHGATDFVTGWSASVSEGVCCPIHEHTDIELVYHRVGSGISRHYEPSKNTESFFPEGSCVVYAPYLSHDQVMDAPGEDLCIHIKVPQALESELSGCLVIPELSREERELCERLTTGKRPSDSLESALYKFRATTLLLSMLRRHFAPEQEAQSSGKQAVHRAEEYIREHFARIQTLQEVADYAGLSHDRLRHLFQEQRSTSLVRFLNQVKMERAKSLLTHSTLPLKQVATLCGFRDEYYFSNVFKKLNGQAPGSFRTGN